MKREMSATKNTILQKLACPWAYHLISMRRFLRLVYIKWTTALVTVMHGDFMPFVLMPIYGNFHFEYERL